MSRPRREFEWSRSQGFVAANSEPGQEYGVDLLAFYRSQPNGNHLAATITRVRGFIRPVFEANTLSSGMPAFASRTSTRTRSTSRTSLSTGQTRIGSPGSRRLSSPGYCFLPCRVCELERRWRLGSGCQGAAQAQRASALSLALCGPPARRAERVVLRFVCRYEASLSRRTSQQLDWPQAPVLTWSAGAFTYPEQLGTVLDAIWQGVITSKMKCR